MRRESGCLSACPAWFPEPAEPSRKTPEDSPLIVRGGDLKSELISSVAASARRSDTESWRRRGADETAEAPPRLMSGGHPAIGRAQRQMGAFRGKENVSCVSRCRCARHEIVCVCSRAGPSPPRPRRPEETSAALYIWVS